MTCTRGLMGISINIHNSNNRDGTWTKLKMIKLGSHVKEISFFNFYFLFYFICIRKNEVGLDDSLSASLLNCIHKNNNNNNKSC